MLAIMTAHGKTKEEILACLKEAIEDLENNPVNNCICRDWEYEIFDANKHIPMGHLLAEDFLRY